MGGVQSEGGVQPVGGVHLEGGVLLVVFVLPHVAIRVLFHD